jgi:hypothetical protein
MDRPLEAEAVAAPGGRAQARAKRVQMFQRLPEQPFGPFRIARAMAVSFTWERILNLAKFYFALIFVVTLKIGSETASASSFPST